MGQLSEIVDDVEVITEDGQITSDEMNRLHGWSESSTRSSFLSWFYLIEN